MDSLLEKFTDLKLAKDDNAKQQEISNKTCLVNDQKLTELVKQTDLDQLFFAQIPASAKYSRKNGRLLNENEINRLQSWLGNVLLSEKDSYTLGSSCELVSQLINNESENGLIFVDRRLDLVTNKSSDQDCFESILIDMVMGKHNLKRVLVINWDRDANQAVQDMFYDDHRVLTISINSRKTRELNFDKIGIDDGLGFNINVEINDDSYTDSDYMSILHNLILPVAYEFNPEIVLIATSFDAIDTNKNSQTNLSASIYSHYLHFLSCLANGKICLFVDIGNVPRLECAMGSFKTISGSPCPRMASLGAPKTSTVEVILNLTAVLRPFWCALQLLNQDDEKTSLEDFVQLQKNDNKYFKFLTSVKVENESESDKKAENSDNNDEVSKTLEGLSLSERRTCICTDEAMMLHYHPGDPTHPERPDRIKAIVQRLKDKNLFERCQSLKSRRATQEELEWCHEREYIDSLKTLEAKSKEELVEMSCNRDSVYYNKDTFPSACLATGCLLTVVDQVCSRKYLNGVAVCRPPGHHAFSDSCSGFCFFNSVAVAVRYAQKKYPSTIKKVMILDFDVHHGNGTQEIFEEDDSVLFISLHRYDDGFFYPAHSDSNYDCIGHGKGQGFTVNIPWNQPQAGDAEYTAAFLRIVMPIAYQFNPDLVMVSAGFDAAAGDPLGGYKVTPVGYAQMTKMLSALANGNLVMALEGGYNLNSISESMSSCVSILLGDVCPAQTTTIPRPQAFKSIRNVTNTLKSYWSCFQFDVEIPDCEFVKKPKWEVRARKPSEMSYGLRTRVKKNETGPGPTQSLSIKSSQEEQVRRSPRLSPKKTATPKKPKESQSSSKKVLLPETEPKKEAQEGAVGGGASSNLPVEFIVDGVSSFAVVPLPYCPHLPDVNQSPDLGLVNALSPCSKCGDHTENWICLSCLGCFCSRYFRGHMAEHFESTGHPMTLSYSDLSTWCYVCDSYVDNSLLDGFKQAAFASKFH